MAMLMPALSSMIARISQADEAAGRIVVVDDDEQVRELMHKLLTRAGYTVEDFGLGAPALDAIRKQPPDLVLLDLVLPDASGNDILEQIRDNEATRLLPVVVMTGHGTRENRLRALRSGVTDFLPKPIVADELLPRVKSLVLLKHFADEHEHAEHVILMLAKMIDARDSYTAGHSGRVAQYACDVGGKLGLKAPEIEDLRRGALFHDIGQIVVPDSILKKTGPLTAEERMAVNEHAAAGFELLSGMKTMRRILPIVLHHHERLDGSGYPDGISGADIPQPVRIISVADVFDAMTSDRAYRQAMTLSQALRVIDEDVGKGRFDPTVVAALKEVVSSSGPLRDGPAPGSLSGLFR
jgi:putative two-component system response regulator